MSGEERSWDDRFTDLMERMMAVQVAGGDPRPLQEELRALVAEQSSTPKKRKKNGTPKS